VQRQQHSKQHKQHTRVTSAVIKTANINVKDQL